jgi:hypothetical protein
MVLSSKVILAAIIVVIVAAISYFLDNGKIAYAQELNDQFLDIFNNITAITLLNYTLITHDDQSVSLNAFLPNETIGADGIPDTMRPIVSYSNSNELVGPNGVEEVLMKLSKSSLPNEIKEQLRNK